MADERDDAASGRRKVMFQLKKIAASPAAEQEDLLQTFARDLRETQPLIAEKIVQWNRDGFFLIEAFASALGSALSRSELHAAEKRELLLEDAADFAAGMATFHNAPNHDLIFRLASAALFVGLRAGLSSEEAEKLRAKLSSEMARAGGTKSGSIRQNASAEWKAYATKQAEYLRSKNPGLSPDDLASRIIGNWKNESFNKVGHSSLVKFLRKLKL